VGRRCSPLQWVVVWGGKNFGFWTSNSVSFDAFCFWVVFLTVQPLIIHEETVAGADPGICTRRADPSSSLPLPSHFLLSFPLEVGLLN